MMRHWPNGIEDVVNTFLNQQLPNLDANTQIWILMEVICGIPEEVSSGLHSMQFKCIKILILGKRHYIFSGSCYFTQ